MTMNPDVKAKWLEALRSGEYAQTKGVLNRTEEEKGLFCGTEGCKEHEGDVRPAGFCCLGVLTDLAVKKGVVGPWVDIPGASQAGIIGGGDDLQTGVLPEKVRRWAGLHEANPVAGDCGLAHYNDREGKTFAEIADIIEEHL